MMETQVWDEDNFKRWKALLIDGAAQATKTGLEACISLTIRLEKASALNRPFSSRLLAQLVSCCKGVPDFSLKESAMKKTL
jgi:hypothetical protein